MSRMRLVGLTAIMVGALAVPSQAGAVKAKRSKLSSKAVSTKTIGMQRGHPRCDDGVLVNIYAHVGPIPIALCI